MKLNPEITNPNMIFVSQNIKMPEITESLLIIQSSERLFKAHLRTFSNMKSADKYRRDSEFIGKGMEIVPRKVSPKETWYRVLIGSFATKDDASEFIEEIMRKGFSVIPSIAAYDR